MKKFVLALLAVVLVLGLCTIASADCITEGVDVENHSSRSFKTYVDPTCTETGKAALKCDACGAWIGSDLKAVASADKAIQQTVPALGHSEHPYVQESATCEDDGIQQINCDRCGIILRTEAIAHEGHKYELVISDNGGDCTTARVVVKACVNVVNGITCGEQKAFTTAAPGHNLEKVDHECKPATCTEPGFDYYICKNPGCDHTETKSKAAIGHDWKKAYTITEATCTTKGLDAEYCANCGETRNTETKAVGHKMSDWTIVHEATCEAEGLKTRYCTNVWCYNGFTQTSATEEAEVIPARGHKWTAGEVIKAATCTEKGETLYVCDCRATKVEEIAALGHTPDEWTVNAELGIKVTTCKVCKAALVEALAPVVPETPADPDAPAVDKDEDEDNNNSEGSGSTTGSGSDASIPATGDNTSNVPYIMMVAAVAGLVVLVASKRKVNC